MCRFYSLVQQILETFKPRNMEKRTIIFEENTEPPKNYYWIKPDNKVYEYNYEDRE